MTGNRWPSGSEHVREFGYALGFAMWRDIQRICREPSAEDREWFPGLAGSDRCEAMDFAMRNFKDESFIAQYLSPSLMREFRLFNNLDIPLNRRCAISSIRGATWATPATRC